MAKNSGASNPDPARKPAEVWQRLIAIGGLEPEGRDKDFAELISAELQPHGGTITEAVNACPDNETLVRAMFKVTAPFQTMSLHIIEFMRKAGTRQGKACIRIALESSVLELKDFEELAATIQTAPGVVEVPDVRIKDVFELKKTMWKHVSRTELPTDVRAWKAAFEKGNFHELPASLHVDAVPMVLAPVARIAATALETLRSFAKTRPDRSGAATEASRASETALITDAVAVAYFEHDLVGPIIEALGRAVRYPQTASISEAIEPILKGLPRRLELSTGDITSLEKVLALPAWKKRYELYAVWIATRIAAAVEPDRVSVHPDENGELSFPFRAIRLATIAGADGPQSLWSERQTECDGLLGKTRTNHVQPDFGLWSGPEDDDRCELIVEVKHYKRPALGTFGAALVDYAKAHPHAQTVLVNYGKAANVAERERWSHYQVLDRCHEIGNLSPENTEACEKFASLVREAAGPEPLPDLLLLDVSASTRGGDGRLFAQSVVQSWLRDSDQAHLKWVVAAAAGHVVWELSRLEAIEKLNEPIAGAGSDPLDIAQQLLESRRRIRVVTDFPGRDSFNDAGFAHFEYLGHATGLELLEIGTG